MTVDEIFTELASHMIKGMMIHEQLANYYDFLGLEGYRMCHEYHFKHETCNYRKLCHYYITHYNKLISDERIEDPKVVPDSWYKYSRSDVDMATKKTSVKTGLTKWVTWESETKKLYEKAYKDLMELGEVAGALYIQEFVCDVDHELKKAKQYWLDKEAVSYDMEVIMSEQKSKHKKYKEKIEIDYNL